jgi:hypothetical protein
VGLLDVFVLQILNLVALVAWWAAKLAARAVHQLRAKRD